MDHDDLDGNNQNFEINLIIEPIFIFCIIQNATISSLNYIGIGIGDNLNAIQL